MHEVLGPVRSERWKAERRCQGLGGGEGDGETGVTEVLIWEDESVLEPMVVVATPPGERTQCHWTAHLHVVKIKGGKCGMCILPQPKEETHLKHFLPSSASHPLTDQLVEGDMPKGIEGAGGKIWCGLQQEPLAGTGGESPVRLNV